jgi:hypothetical protein
MYLLLSIFLSAILGYVILMMGPLLGGIIAFGIVVGSIFRGLYLLSDIHKRMLNDAPIKDKVQQTYEKYLKENKSE